MWTPTPDEELERALSAALARPGASRVIPPRPVARTDAAGWLWGWMRLPDGAWLGLATLYKGRFWEGAELDWHPAEELRPLN